MLKIFQSGELPESVAIDQIIPELKKSISKVCSRIYTFMMNKFQIFSATNLSMIQQNLSGKYKPLMIMIKKNVQELFNDLIIKYITIVNKLYVTISNNYFNSTLKLLNEKQDKFDFVYSDLNK
jgi:hypothetical protein